jgi:hypothetical protein
MAEPLVLGPSLVEVEITIGKLKRCKFLDTDQILAELIKAGGETLHFEMYSLTHSIWNKEDCYSSARNLLLYQFIKRVM